MASTSVHVETTAALKILIKEENVDISDAESICSEESGDELMESEAGSSDDYTGGYYGVDESDEEIDQGSGDGDNGSDDGTDYSPVPTARRPGKRPANARLKGPPATRQRQQPGAGAKPLPASVKAPSGDIWKTDTPPPARSPQKNVVTEVAGPRNIGGNKSKLQLFQLFITTGMMNVILANTNQEGLRQRGLQWSDMALMELHSTIGLLLFLGLTKSGRDNIRSHWRKGPFARPLCMATISGTRLQDILTMLRFDDKATSQNRRLDDKFAPIRDIFDDFANSCRRYYTAGEFTTVGEQLVPFRGRCRFRQYMPSKTAKYGIKFWLNVDVDTHYVLNISPYLGKEGDQVTTNVGAKVVKTLLEPLYNTGRNVTMDNYFTSATLAKHLLTKNITLVGTIKGNRREIPEEVRPQNTKKRPAKSSVFLFTDDPDLTLVSFIPRPNRSVLLLSSKHHDNKINPTTQKPDMIHFYNSTKGGVDTVDQMCSLYTCSRKTKRWPMAVFYNMLNLAALNSYILWHSLNPGWAQRHSRHEFYSDLIMELVKPQIELRASNPTGLHTLTTNSMEILGFKVDWKSKRNPPPLREPHDRNYQSGDCKECPARRQGGKRTTTRCSHCNSFVCTEHSKKYVYVRCNSCASGEH